jgi:hypothetical protein
VRSTDKDNFVQISDLPALTGLAANKCTYHVIVNHFGAICNKQAEAEK